MRTFKHFASLIIFKFNATATARNYCRCFEERDRLKSETVSDLTAAYKFLAEPKTEPASASRFAERDGKTCRSIDEAANAFHHFPESDLPDNLITKSGFEHFIGECVIKLTDDDLIARTVIRLGYENGMTFSPETILETLQRFNPARAGEVFA
jgi:hypothetical protein